MSTYQAKKNMAREEAIEWQEYAAKQSMSYMDTVLEQETIGLQAWAKKYIAQSLWTDYAKTPRDATGRIREEWTVWCGTQESPTAISFKAGTSKEEIRSWFKETFGLIPA